MNQEPPHETWKHYKDLVRKCPHHQLPKWNIVVTFYNWLNMNIQLMVDAARGSSVNYKIPDEVYEHYEKMASKTTIEELLIRTKRSLMD